MAASICINGSELEGGGQIIRVATALCCIQGESLKIVNVRGNRKPPGLKAQSLTGLKVTTQMCNGIISNTSIGSMEFEFHPGKLKGGNYEADTKTAGSICLLLQITLPCLIYAKEVSRVVYLGGTNAEFAPSIDYYQQVFLPSIVPFGIKCDIKVVKRGFYPKGGGKVIADISPVQHLNPIDLVDFGSVVNITGLIYIAGNLSTKLAQAMLEAAQLTVKKGLPDMKFSCVICRDNNDRAVGSGLGIFLKAVTSTGCILGSSGISKKGVDSAETSRIASNELVQQIQNQFCVDQHLQDQLIIFMALAKGFSRIKCGPLTLHTKTAISISERILKVKFNSESTDDGRVVLSCQGIGMEYKD